MTSTETTARTGRAKLGKMAVSMIGGALVGMLGAKGLLHLVETGQLGEPGLSQVIALLVALIYVLTGLIVLVGLISPAVGSRFLNVEDPDELREQKSMLLASGWSMLLLGALLAVIALGGPGALIAPTTTLVVAGILLAIAIALSVRSIRLYDELMRSLSSEAAQTAYYLQFLVIGGWAILAHLGFVQPPAMLDVLTSFWALMLLATFWVAGRRGMLNPR